MSQLSKAIQAFDTGDRKIHRLGLSPLFTDVFDAKSEWRDDPTNILKIYKIGVKLETTAAVTDTNAMKMHNPFEEAVNRSKRQIIEAVYGEFRQYFRRIESAIYNHNMEEAGRLLHEMERVMFDD